MKKNTKSKAAIISIISNTLLISIKLIASFITGSISILSEALHSLSDLIASVITWISVKYSDMPPDEKHPYGHGRIENVTATIEALLVIIAAIYIIYESLSRLINVQKIEHPIIGIIVLLISFIINLFVSNYLYKIAKKEKSLALEGDALHLRADMFTSLAMLLGFVFIFIYKWYIIDSIFAILVAIYMLIEGYMLFKKAFNPLLDEAISEKEMKIILNYFKHNNYSVHDIKTRKSGNIIFIDVHLELHSEITLKEAHDVCEKIENEMKNIMKDIQINIHVEPKNNKD
jgi:cation diffusion facilitator family transporter